MKLKIYCEIKRNCVLNAIVSGRKGHNQTLRWPFHSIDTIKHSRTSFVQTTTFLYLKTVASYGPQLENCKRWGEKIDCLMGCGFMKTNSVSHYC